MKDEELRVHLRRAQAGDAEAQAVAEREWLRRGLGWHGETLPPRLRPTTTRNKYCWNAGEGLELELSFVPAGNATVTVEDEWRGPVLLIARVERGFWICTHQISRDAYLRRTGLTNDHHASDSVFSFEPWHAMVHVSFFEAEDFCRGVGLDLPNESEWDLSSKAGVFAFSELEQRNYEWCDNEYTYTGIRLDPRLREALPEESRIQIPRVENQVLGRVIRGISNTGSSVRWFHPPEQGRDAITFRPCLRPVQAE